MSDYKMVPVVATEEIYDAVTRANLTRDVKSPERKREIVLAAIAKAPPFVVTDGIVERACAAYKAACESDFIAEGGPMRAAIEAVLGGGK